MPETRGPDLASHDPKSQEWRARDAAAKQKTQRLKEFEKGHAGDV
jgi:hypothetical protein